jgi:hypothetical protein
MRGVPRELLRLVYRDPEHVSERLTLFAAHRLAEPARQWAETVCARSPDEHPEDLAYDLLAESARIARIDGAVTGTPFYLALVPGYINYLWQEGRMTLRLAALYGRDPAALRTSAELLCLRAVHPTVEAAEAALLAIAKRGPPPRPEGRRPLRVWIQSVRRVLVFGGFLGAADAKPRKGIRAFARDAFGLAVAGGVWVVTWIFPVTFMIAMAWSCETHTRRLFDRTLAQYAPAAVAGERANRRLARKREDARRSRSFLGVVALGVSIAVPVAFLAFLIHLGDSALLSWARGVGALVAVSLVLGMAIRGSRV